MGRLTIEEKDCGCRVGHCNMEEYICELLGISYTELIFKMVKNSVCENCPLEPIANKLAEYEDEKYD